MEDLVVGDGAVTPVQDLLPSEVLEGQLLVDVDGLRLRCRGGAGGRGAGSTTGAIGAVGTSATDCAAAASAAAATA
ncbi:hypothetical protein ACFC0C_27155 [Streptomyces sp. NPDC056178]|uniref:hypothetical protein n=1 Tax=unclassified Streptomyces TaxID=2593676 RepID=UPI0035DF5C6D